MPMQPAQSTSDQRLQQIALARSAVLFGNKSAGAVSSQSWIERSWQRSLASGKRPDQPVSFDVIAPNAIRHLQEANHTLVSAAKPVLESLGHAIFGTRYFAILTDAQGIVIDAHGPIDRSDRRADLITRIGCDLSEQSVATTAIGAALHELQSVWLHRGEHFFDANSAYSCAGAPLFGPHGNCIGMLDLTGIDVAERPELQHLVAQSARGIENALTLAHLSHTQDLLIRLNWPGRTIGDETDGLICLNADGCVTAANQTAHVMVPQLQGRQRSLHASDLFAMAFEMLFDAASRPERTAIEVPLWTGLRLHAKTFRKNYTNQGAERRTFGATTSSTTSATTLTQRPAAAPPLKDIETALIRKAVDEARGNVQQAAKMLGISRATVYRRLGANLKKR